jgi:hypothetical protein
MVFAGPSFGSDFGSVSGSDPDAVAASGGRMLRAWSTTGGYHNAPMRGQQRTVNLTAKLQNQLSFVKASY